uniref:Transposase n=1 Tax=Aedes aegypti TaxID=7159 RepID=A9X5H4_AEDAE|nr:transposase [Aedes aegypti]
MDKWLLKKPKSEDLEAEKKNNADIVAGPSGGGTRRKLEEELPSTSAKKKTRQYDSDYLQYGFMEDLKDKFPRPQCVICLEVLANESMRPNKLIRHLETKHPEFKDKTLDFFTAKVKALNCSRDTIQAYTKVSDKAMVASYHLSLKIAKSGKAHTIGENLILPALKETVSIMFGPKFAQEIESIPLSNNTVARRIEDLSGWVENELVERIKASTHFSLQLDESTDVEGLSQLIVFVRYFWKEDVHEEMLFCEPIMRGTSDEIFDKLNSYIKANGLYWENCIGVCTDGARAMCGKNSGVVTRILKLSPNASWTHCSLHREALVAKTLCDDFKNVLTTTVKIVNFVKTKPLQSRLFEKLCEDMGSNFTSLLLHTEVRWLSRGKVLTRVVELREELATFLEGKENFSTLLRDKDFSLKIAYLSDIFQKLNHLNTYLQGSTSMDIFDVHDKIRGFMRKLDLWSRNLKNGNYDCFDSLQTLIVEKQFKPSSTIINGILGHLKSLKEKFGEYFDGEMKKTEKNLWIVDPFNQNEASTNISTKADEELIDLSENSTLKINYDRKNILRFWISVRHMYPCLYEEAVKFLLPFTTSYLCEAGFSEMVAIKTKYRNKLRLSPSLRLKLTGIEIDVSQVIDNNRKQSHPSH